MLPFQNCSSTLSGNNEFDTSLYSEESKKLFASKTEDGREANVFSKSVDQLHLRFAGSLDSTILCIEYLPEPGGVSEDRRCENLFNFEDLRSSTQPWDFKDGFWYGYYPLENNPYMVPGAILRFVLSNSDISASKSVEIQIVK